MVWEKTYGGLGRDYLSSILRMEDGGYLLSGTTESYGSDSNNLWLVKVTPGERSCGIRPLTARWV